MKIQSTFKEEYRTLTCKKTQQQHMHMNALQVHLSKKKKKKKSEFNLESFFCKRQLLLAFSQAILTAVLVLNASSFLKK